MKELKDAHKYKDEDIKLRLANEADESSNGILLWKAVLRGPKESPFQDGSYEVLIKALAVYVHVNAGGGEASGAAAATP